MEWRLKLLIKLFIFFCIVHCAPALINQSKGLKCHSCYGLANSPGSCLPLPLIILRQQMQSIATPTPSVKLHLEISEDPNVCLKIKIDQKPFNGHSLTVIIKTGIIMEKSNFQSLEMDNEFNDVCQSRHQDNSNYSVCTCTTNYCNGHHRLNFNVHYSKILTLVVIFIQFG